MTGFVIACAAMIVAALLWIVLPLLRAQQPDDATTRRERRIASVAVAVLVPALAAGMYAILSDWDWSRAQTTAAEQAEMDDLLQQLRAKLAANPGDVNGWLLLGRSYGTMQRYDLAVDAFQNAYERSNGENVEATIGLGEVLVMTNQGSLTGRAAQLFDEALARAPNHPKALWYGGLAALQGGDLRLGRDRLQALLAQSPPEQFRSVLERQIQDLNQQLGAAGQGPATASAATGSEGAGGTGRTIRVAVSLAPQIAQRVSSPMPLFVLARDAAAGGPPLAVKRRSSTELPLSLELSEQDAMIASRTIASVPRVQVVARLSRSGTPQAQSGDFYGEAEYDFAKNAGTSGGTLNIIIDRIVP